MKITKEIYLTLSQKIYLFKKKRQQKHIKLAKEENSYEFFNIVLCFIIFLIIFLLFSFFCIGQMDPYTNGAWRFLG